MPGVLGELKYDFDILDEPPEIAVEEDAKGKERKGAKLILLVSMTCKKCGGDVDFVIQDSCPTCGLIYIRCKVCKYSFSFGE